MLTRLAIVSGLATTLGAMSILSFDLATTPALGATAIFNCGGQRFVGTGIDHNNAKDIARIKARDAGFDPDTCNSHVTHTERY
jgi:hypothetical protein